MVNYGQYTIGRVVERNADGLLGHIVGFDRARYDNGHVTILEVKWEDQQSYSIHPCNVKVL